MIDPKVTVDAKSAIRAFAELKGVNVYVVIFNAMKDFVAEAYRQTPIANLNESKWAVLPQKQFPRVKKEYQYVRIQGSLKQQQHLMEHRVNILRKWSMTSWIGAFKAMGMGSAAGGVSSFSRRHQGNKTLTMENVVKNKTEKKRSDLESITVIDRIWFDKLPGEEYAIIQAGKNKAAMNIAREFDRELKRRWK